MRIAYRVSRIVAIVFGILGSGVLFIAALIAFLAAGANSLIGEVANNPVAKENVSDLTWLGTFGLIGSIVALIGACLTVAKPRTAVL